MAERRESSGPREEVEVAGCEGPAFLGPAAAGRLLLTRARGLSTREVLPQQRLLQEGRPAIIPPRTRDGISQT